MARIADRLAGDRLGDRRLTAKPKRKPAVKKRPTKPLTKRPAKRKPSIAKNPWRKKLPEHPPEDASEPSASPGGRPTSFRPEFVEQARKLCAVLGATDADLAAFFEVHRSTIHRWQVAEPAFRDALQVAKETADDRVARSLYHRAVGYSHEAVKIFLPKDSTEPVLVPYVEHFPPDTTACIFWLKNRDKKNWRDVQEFEHAGKVAVEITDKDRAKALAALMAKLKAKGENNTG